MTLTWKRFAPKLHCVFNMLTTILLASDFLEGLIRVAKVNLN